MCMCVRACVCMYVCVCVRERVCVCVFIEIGRASSASRWTSKCVSKSEKRRVSREPPDSGSGLL